MGTWGNTIEFGEHCANDDHAQIKDDKQKFLQYQKKIDALNVQIKEIKKSQKEHKDNIFKYLEDSNISSIIVEDYVFTQAVQDRFSCTKELLEEKFPDIDTSEFCKTKKSKSIKMRNNT